MAEIIDGKRRMIKLSVDDVIAVIRQYQEISHGAIDYEHTRKLIKKVGFYLPEDI